MKTLESLFLFWAALKAVWFFLFVFELKSGKNLKTENQVDGCQIKELFGQTRENCFRSKSESKEEFLRQTKEESRWQLKFARLGKKLLEADFCHVFVLALLFRNKRQCFPGSSWIINLWNP